MGVLRGSLVDWGSCGFWFCVGVSMWGLCGWVGARGLGFAGVIIP